MPHSDAEGPEELRYKKGEKWAGVREDNVLPAVSSSPLPLPANLPWDLMQDRGSVPGPGMLKAGPAVPALPCPQKGGDSLEMSGVA